MMNSRGNFLASIPQVTKVVLIINVAVFIVGYFLLQSGVRLNSLVGLHNFMPSAYDFQDGGYGFVETFKPLQLVTHMFLHGGLGHLFFNMFGLIMFGKVLESVLGSKKFFILYFVSGLGAAFIQLGVNYFIDSKLAQEIMLFYQSPDPDIFYSLLKECDFSKLLNSEYTSKIIALTERWLEDPTNADLELNAIYYMDLVYKVRISIPMVGASGALMGILAAFALYFPNVELMLLFLPIPIKAKYLIPLFMVASLFLGISNVAFTNVAHFAHLGGAIVGFILVKIWKKNQFNIM